jgi:hypothetical protein
LLDGARDLDTIDDLVSIARSDRDGRLAAAARAVLPAGC